MAGEIATAYVQLEARGGPALASSVRGQLAAVDGDASRAGDRAGRSFSSRFAASAGKGVAIGGALAIGAGIAFTKEAVREASNLGESINAVNVTYGKTARGIRVLSREAADGLGLSASEFNSLAVQFSAFATTVGGKGAGAVKVIDELSTRGADFASVMNLEVNQAMELFQSGLAGETEPLRKFGIDLSAASVQAYAVREGLVAAGEEMTEQEKVQARYGSLMEQTAKTQGDFANTSDSLANSQRRLGARFDDIQARLGRKLLPVLEDFSGWILDEGLPAFEGFIDEMETGKGFGGDVVDFFKDVKSVGGDAAGVVRDVVEAFNDMPEWARKGLLIGGGSALAAGKVNSLLGGGRSGGLGGLVSRATPTPVFVTNPGFSAGGMGGGKTPPGGVPVPGAPGGKTPGPLGGSPKMPGFWGSLVLGGVAAASAGSSMRTTNEEGEPLRNLDDFNKPTGSPGFKLPDLGGITQAIKLVGDYGKLVSSLPKDVRTEVTAPGAVKTKADVVDLAKKYDLTPKEVRTLMRVNDFATKDIVKVQERLRETDNMRPKPAVDVLAGAAFGAIQAVKTALNNIPDEEVRVNIIRNNQGGQTNSQGGHSADGASALGGPIGAGRTHLVGEYGPELYTAASAGRITSHHATAEALRGAAGARTARLTITNWRDGTGYFEEVAGGVGAADADYADTVRRLHR